MLGFVIPANGLVEKALRGVKGLRPERRGNLEVVYHQYVEIAASACGGLAMTRYGGFSTSPNAGNQNCKSTPGGSD